MYYDKLSQIKRRLDLKTCMVREYVIEQWRHQFTVFSLFASQNGKNKLSGTWPTTPQHAVSNADLVGDSGDCCPVLSTTRPKSVAEDCHWLLKTDTTTSDNFGKQQP